MRIEKKRIAVYQREVAPPPVTNFKTKLSDKTKRLGKDDRRCTDPRLPIIKTNFQWRGGHATEGAPLAWGVPMAASCQNEKLASTALTAPSTVAAGGLVRSRLAWLVASAGKDTGLTTPTREAALGPIPWAKPVR